MLDEKDVANKVEAVRRALQSRLGVKGRDLGHALRRAGRRLPARVRKQGSALAQAEFLSRNPKMARRMDGAQVQSAYDEVVTHLHSIDAKDIRIGRALSIAGPVAFNILFVAVAFITFLGWRGYV